jgi:hypothetical protein
VANRFNGQQDRGDSDVVSFGPGEPTRRPWARWLLLAAAAIAVIALVVVRVSQHESTAPANRHRPPQPSSSPQIAVVPGHLLPGVTAQWEVVARGNDFLATLQPATGKLTRTPVPPLLSGNPEVALLVGPHQVVIRSYDLVPGYVIPDGAPARPLTGPLMNPGPVLPGPKPGQAWVFVGGPGPAAIALVAADGRITSTTIRLPARAEPATASSDGRGYVLLFTDKNQLYDAGPTWYRRIDAQVLAVGPSRWLGLICHRQHCSNVSIDAATGAQRILPGPALGEPFTSLTVGVASPDGSFAALPVYGQGGQANLRLVNLKSGARTALSVSMDPFVVTPDGQLVAVNIKTRIATDLAIAPPPVTQITIGPPPVASGPASAP